MNLKKSGLLLVLLFLVSIFVVSCDDNSNDGIDFGNVWEKVISIGKLEFLGFKGDNAVAGFVRILIAILIFAVLYEASHLLKFSRNISITIALVLAIMTAVFIPSSILAGIGGAYATIVGIVLIAIPVLAGGYVLYRIPSDSTWRILLKIVIILIMLWVLMAVKSHAKALIV